ncbi:MAG: class I SAM-dependent methyltransferase [Bacteroidetes bacterium]|nr:class I SAM-dependent methyltransferase [Bacteroidota bacterium]
MEATVVESLSKNAGSFNERYAHDPNFIQRYNVWTNTIDRFSGGVKSAYDMGCGGGVLSFYLASKHIQTTGFDGAEGMISLCNRQKNERNISNVDFRLAMLPFENHSALPKVELIVSSSVIEYIDEIDQTIQMFSELLKPNGKLIVSFPNKDSVYRKIEMNLFRLFRKPAYFRFVKNIWTKEEAETKFGKHSFRLSECTYFSDRSFISGVAGIVGGSKRAGNLTLMVFEKL